MAEMAAKCLTVLIWLTAALGLLPYGNLRRAGWRNLLFFCILGLQLTFSLQYLEYGLLLTFRDLTPMRLEGRELLAERILFFAAVFLVIRLLSWLLHRKLNFSRYLVGGALQTSLLVSSGIALAFSLIMNAYSARYHYPISINWSNAALFSSCLLMTVLYLALTGWAFRRKAKLEEKQILYRQLQDYIHSLEEYNTSLRIYRHDYTNLLLAARLYVEQKDWEKLEKFHREILLPFYEKYLHEGDEK